MQLPCTFNDTACVVRLLRSIVPSKLRAVKFKSIHPRRQFYSLRRRCRHAPNSELRARIQSTLREKETSGVENNSLSLSLWRFIAPFLHKITKESRGVLSARRHVHIIAREERREGRRVRYSREQPAKLSTFVFFFFFFYFPLHLNLLSRI